MAARRPLRPPAPVRWCVLAAALGGATTLVLTPLVTFAGWKAGPGQTYPGMVWARTIEPLVIPFLGFGAREEVYATYGKMFLPIFLLLAACLISFHALVAGRAGRLERIGFRIAPAGLAMNLVGNDADYWLGKGVLHQPLWGMAFAIGTLLRTPVYVVGSVFIGAFQEPARANRR